MQFIPIKTRAMLPPKDNVYNLLDDYLPKLKDNDILIVTSKIVSIHEGRCVKMTHRVKKDELILREAEKLLPRSAVPNSLAILTIKNHTLIASAGVDSKNGRGYFLLWPKNPMRSAKAIWRYLVKKHKLRKLGIIISDSHSAPLRHGTIGVALGFYGFQPLRTYSHSPNLFGGRLKHAQVNVVDSLAALSPLLMGEGNEQTPLVLVRDAETVNFTVKQRGKEWFTKFEDDIYAPLLKIFKSKRLTKKRKTHNT